MPNRLQELRIAANLSTRDLERATGIDHAAISRLETKDQGMSEHYARVFADHFNVTIDYLLCRTDEKLAFSRVEVRETPLTYRNVLFALNSFTNEELLRLSGTIDFLLEDRHKKQKGEPQLAKDKSHSIGKPDAN